MASSNSAVFAKILSGTYKELEDGLTGGCDDRGEYETKQYLVPWSERSNFIREFKGTARTSGGIGGTWTTVVPYQLPDNGTLYARDISFVPEGALVPNVTPIQFTHARMTVTFRKPDFNFNGQADDPGGELNSLDPGNEALAFATQELDFAKEWMTLPNAGVKFKSDGKAIQSSMGRSTTVVTMSITWHRFPVMPLPLLQYFGDSVNNATFLGCNKGTVMFEGARTTREADSTGAVTQKVQMNFKWRQFDWNKALREDANTGTSWDTVVDKSYTSGSSDAFVAYPYRDFSKLLLGSARLASGLMSPPGTIPGP